jgi:hypothetical protein
MFLEPLTDTRVALQVALSLERYDVAEMLSSMSRLKHAVCLRCGVRGHLHHTAHGHDCNAPKCTVGNMTVYPTCDPSRNRYRSLRP